MDKQIEEMAKYCCNTCPMNWGHNIGDCAEKGEQGYRYCSLAKETAEMIYNAGYRKIPEGAVVINKDTEKFAEMLKSRFDKSREYRTVDTGTAWPGGYVGCLINDEIDKAYKEFTEDTE